MLFTTDWVSEIFTTFQGAADTPIAIENVTTDSRVCKQQSLFIPLKGDTFDGHDYIKQAFDNGARAAFWDKERERPRFLPTDFPFFLVEDTLDALQKLAYAYRKKVDPVVVGITGSNGKTTTKDLVASVLGTTFRTHYTAGNFNNHIGLPLTILSMPRHTQMLALEMGMNHFGEIRALSEIARPDYGIITNIGESHIEFLGSRKGISRAKLEIIDGMSPDGTLIVDGDEPLLEHLHTQEHVITCGFCDHNDVIVDEVAIGREETTFRLNEEHYEIPLLGKHHALNAAFAATLGRKAGINSIEIKQALASFAHASMRFEMVRGTNGASIINDAYNASPTSMKAAIEVVKQIEGFRQKILVLGDIFELGDHSRNLHQSVARVIDDSIDALFTLGERAEDISLIVREQNDAIRCRHMESKEALLSVLQPYLQEDALLLFKASRGMQLESIIEQITDHYR